MPYKKIIVLFAVLVLPWLIYFILTTATHNLNYLPYYGPREVKTVIVDGEEGTDTVYHTIPDFQFTDQKGRTITDKDFEGKIYVADFFFTTCKSICPKMATQLYRVQGKFKNVDDFAILSHTVYPEHDSVSVLAAYADKTHAMDDKWYFVTGDKKPIYDIARHGYFVTTSEGDGGPDDFIHSEMFILVDKERRIRGYYDGTSTVEVNKLIDAIKALFAEYNFPKKSE